MVIAFQNFRARFLQRGIRGGNCRSWSCERPAWHACRVGGRKAAIGLIEHRGELAEPPLGAASERRLLIDGFLRRVLCPSAAVEGVVQCEAVVALSHRVVCLLQRFDRRVIFGRRVSIGSGGARSVDGALRLIHLPTGWRRASGDVKGSDKHCKTP